MLRPANFDLDRSFASRGGLGAVFHAGADRLGVMGDSLCSRDDRCTIPLTAKELGAAAFGAGGDGSWDWLRFSRSGTICCSVDGLRPVAPAIALSNRRLVNSALIPRPVFLSSRGRRGGLTD